MIKGPHIIDRLEAIDEVLRDAPAIDVQDLSEIEVALAAGQMSAYCKTVHRMIRAFIDDVQRDVEKDIEFERRWQKDFEEARKTIKDKEDTDAV